MSEAETDRRGSAFSGLNVSIRVSIIRESDSVRYVQSALKSRSNPGSFCMAQNAVSASGAPPTLGVILILPGPARVWFGLLDSKYPGPPPGPFCGEEGGDDPAATIFRMAKPAEI